MAHNEAHNALVRDALQELAIAGFTAWKNETGVWFEKNEDGEKGRPHKYGKKGSADIIIILPRRTLNIHTGECEIIGQHVEAEAKTGTGRQSKSQCAHQEFVVERNGGIYMIFRSTPELLCRLREIK